MTKNLLKITELFAFITKDDEGNEGIMGVLMSDDKWLPLIGADIDRVKSLIPLADNIKKTTGRDYEIRYFTQKN